MKKINLFLLFLLLNQLLAAQASPSFQVEVVGTSSEHIILIPGFSCSGDVWEATVDQLSPTYTCHVLTFAGFADVPTNSEADWADWREDIAQYIADKNLGKTSIIGHSLGGMMALDLASSYQELIKEVVVVDALPCLSALNNPSFKSEPTIDCKGSIDMMVNQSAEQFEMMQRSSVGYMSTSTDKHDQIVQWAMNSDRATLGKIFCELSNIDLRNDLKNIKCPALILLEAPFKPMDKLIAKQYELLNDVQLNYAPKGLHFVMFDAPEWYADQLSNYFFNK